MTAPVRWTRFYPRSISGRDSEDESDTPTNLHRAYKCNKRGWPRLLLSVYLDNNRLGSTTVAVISCSVKPALGQHWVQADIPVYLLSDLMEMLAMVQNEADK